MDPDGLLARAFPQGFIDKLPGEDVAIPEGTVLMERGAPPRNLWILREGAVEVVLAEGERVRVQAPSVFGEIGFLTGDPAGADVGSIAVSNLRRCDTEVLRSWAAEDPARASILYAGLSRIASQRVAGSYHRSYCAVVAHDGRKAELMDFMARYREFFAGRHLLATATTASRVESELGLMVDRVVCSGPRGGDQEIGALVARGLVDVLFFFRDPMWAQPHHADVNALVRVCELHDVPLATNLRTADLLLQALIHKESAGNSGLIPLMR